MKKLGMMLGLLGALMFMVTGSDCGSDTKTRTIDTEVNEELDGDTEVEKTKVTTNEETGETEVIEEETDIDSEGNVTEKEVETEE